MSVISSAYSAWLVVWLVVCLCKCWFFVLFALFLYFVFRHVCFFCDFCYTYTHFLSLSLTLFCYIVYLLFVRSSTPAIFIAIAIAIVAERMLMNGSRMLRSLSKSVNKNICKLLQVYGFFIVTGCNQSGVIVIWMWCH